MKSLPNVIPVFPLNGVIYFPKTNLPLNIFEQRYLDLVNDMNTITEMYFQKKEVLKMDNKNVHSTKHRFTGEKIMIYVK